MISLFDRIEKLVYQHYDFKTYEEIMNLFKQHNLYRIFKQIDQQEALASRQLERLHDVLDQLQDIVDVCERIKRT